MCNISSKCTTPVSALSLSVYICCGHWSMEGFQNTGPMGTKACVQHTHINTHTELLIIESHYSRLTISLLIIYLSAATFAAQSCSCGGKHGNDGREEGDKEKSLKCFCNRLHCSVCVQIKAGVPVKKQEKERLQTSVFCYNCARRGHHGYVSTSAHLQTIYPPTC